MPQSERLKIAYLCENTPDKVWSHSGGNTRIYEALKRHVGDVTVISDSWGWLEWLRQLIHRLPEALLIRLRFRVHLLLARVIARSVERQLKKHPVDVLFCAYSFFSLVKVNVPKNTLVVFTSDATYTAYKQSPVGEKFGSYLSFSRLLDAWMFKHEKIIYPKCDLLLWPSHWIKNNADRLYGLTYSQSHVVYWGANVPTPPRESLHLDNPLTSPVKLLLVGRDWVPKGGPVVLEILKSLIKKGIDAQLTVVGCQPPEEDLHSAMTVYPQLNKQIPEELDTFTSLFRDSHFFVMPSYEAYGFAFCEAAAFGLPALCWRIGGIPVEDDVSGHALPEGALPEAFAEKILEYFDDPQRYVRLRHSSRKFFEQHLNWDAWARHVARHIEAKRHHS